MSARQARGAACAAGAAVLALEASRLYRIIQATNNSTDPSPAIVTWLDESYTSFADDKQDRKSPHTYDDDGDPSATPSESDHAEAEMEASFADHSAEGDAPSSSILTKLLQQGPTSYGALSAVTQNLQEQTTSLVRLSQTVWPQARLTYRHRPLISRPNCQGSPVHLLWQHYSHSNCQRLSRPSPQ
ncbi:hypothetical protein WJX84_010445 [Apatococcus fuscideae]|uniref:Uncharacterized protein n=1 Tax=Apatococcus fuscideae TaxID=2026836 RepID=A0AAW1S910_9CHLO